MRNRWINRGALLLVALAGGCGSTVSVGNGNPTGTVGGIVIDATNEAPLMGATVNVISAGKTFTSQPSDMNGVFSVANVPSGDLIVQIVNMGYLTAQFNATLGGAVGNFPVNNPVETIGPIGLIPATGSFAVRLVDESGAPVPMVKVVGTTAVRFVDFGLQTPGQLGAGVATGNVVFNATSDTNGLVTFSGLPAYSSLGSYVDDTFRVTVPPVQVMGTNSYQFLGLTSIFHPAHLDTTQQSPTIVLAGPHTPLTVLESNVAYLRFQATFDTSEGLTVPPAGPITVTFNQAIDAGSVRVAFYNEDGVTPAPSQPTATVTTNILTITPAAALPSGARFNMDLHVASALAATQTDVSSAEFNVQSAPFFTAPPAGSKPSVNMGTLSKTTVGANTQVQFALTEPIGLGRGLSGGISCIAFYEGVNLDNGDSAPYPGEYDNNGQSLQCYAQGSPLPALDITAIYPIEQAPVITGFATRWAVNIDQPATTGPCKPIAGITCTRPAVGTKVHLVFDKLPPGSTLRRTNGDVVATDAVNLTFVVPP